MLLGRELFKSKVCPENYMNNERHMILMHDLFIATIPEESHRAFLLNTQLFTILRLEDQEEALTSKQGTRSVSADSSYPLSQILAVFGAGMSIFTFTVTIPTQYSYYIQFAWLISFSSRPMRILPILYHKFLP